MLLTVWRLSRAEFSASCDQLDEYIEVADAFPNIRALVGYLVGKQMTSYFEKALHLLKTRGVDVDKLLK